jgi:hypothetical protein
MTTSLLTPPRTDLHVHVEDERRARADLRAQIARLEARGAARAAGAAGPRVLGLGELEALRDAMLHPTHRLGRHVPAATATGPADASAHARLEAMLADPPSHRGERIALRELGRPGCGAYMVRPRLGLVGMLAGWWEVKLSSGCP